jgi:hypothetical protein
MLQLEEREMSVILELAPENETVGQGRISPLESADGAGAGDEADTQEARGGVQGEGDAVSDLVRSNSRRAGEN